jgi:hypothetical protein
MAIVGGIPLSRPFVLGLYFVRYGCASCFREERIEMRDLPNLLKRGRMFVWFSHLVDSDLHQYSCVFGSNHLLSCAEIFFILLFFKGIFGLIFNLVI